MSISLNDTSVLTSYVQIIMRDTLGLSVVAPRDLGESSIDDTYNISNTPIRVTGTYDLATYSAVALYMAINYPNEKFPVRYDKYSVDGDIATEFDRSKLISTINFLLGLDSISENYYKFQYEELEDKSTVFDWDTLMKYYDSYDNLNTYLRNDKSVEGLYNKALLTFITHNIEYSVNYKPAVDLSDRILSYILGEVVSDISSEDEIYRIQKLIITKSIPACPLFSKCSNSGSCSYGKLGINAWKIDSKVAGKYTDDLSKRVRYIQCMYLSKHTPEGSLPDLQSGFEGFKVTGYVDPWTELIVKGDM